jgi:predicted ester cyclase
MKGESTMSAENKTIARRVRDEIWNGAALNVADQVFDSGSIYHVGDTITPDFGSGPEGYKKLVTLYRSAFPDARMTLDDGLVDGDKVMVRWTARATHKGQLLNLAPTNRQITVTGIDVYRISGGKIQETWVNWDALGFLQQLGAVPALGQTKEQSMS